MKKWILCLLLSGWAFNYTEAADCSRYQDRIHKLEDLRRHGGSLKQVERWRMQEDELRNKLNSCNHKETIQIASGNTYSSGVRTTKKASNKQKLRKTNNPDPHVQQLLSTCNYWINEYNATPSSSNNSFKDTACRALDEQISIKNSPASAEITNVRGLKECIKPNNLIDNDVQECRQGLREPTWKHNNE